MNHSTTLQLMMVIIAIMSRGNILSFKNCSAVTYVTEELSLEIPAAIANATPPVTKDSPLKC